MALQNEASRGPSVKARLGAPHMMNWRRIVGFWPHALLALTILGALYLYWWKR